MHKMKAISYLKTKIPVVYCRDIVKPNNYKTYVFENIDVVSFIVVKQGNRFFSLFLAVVTIVNIEFFLCVC